VTVYVLTEPSQPVDTIVTVFPDPTLSAEANDVAPDATTDPATVIEPPPARLTGRNEIDVTPFPTVAVYEYVVCVKAGVRLHSNLPAVRTKLSIFGSAFTDAVLVTAIVYVVLADVPS
jgi:hypothetical protein